MLVVDTGYQAKRRSICPGRACQDWIPEGSNPEVHLSKIKKMEKGSQQLEIIWGIWEPQRLLCRSARSSDQRSVWRSAGLITASPAKLKKLTFILGRGESWILFFSWRWC